jgi:hypothetical protein
MQKTDNTDALALSLESTLEEILQETNIHFLTTGNSPRSTIGIKHGYWWIHTAEMKEGFCCPDGTVTAVVLKPTNQLDLVHVTYMYVIAGVIVLTVKS